MSDNEPKSTNEAEESQPRLSDTNASFVHQDWTTSGYPIVDGKYLDLAKGKIELAGPHERTKAGPPAVALYWHNRKQTGGDGQFCDFSASAFVDVTEYLLRFGDFLKMGSCDISALNATKYAVSIIFATDLSEDEVMARMKKCNIFPALKIPNA